MAALVFRDVYHLFSYQQIAVTNIIGTYGQGWPGLLYLSWLTFLDSTQRNALGIKNQTQLTDFFRGHESSHQWWGQRVGWKGYHDQWLSEGFAEFSGMLFIQFRDSRKESLAQFRLDKQLLSKEDLNRHKVQDLGPIWRGRRIRSSITNPRSYQDLIYSKGGYVLQMIRTQLVDPRNPVRIIFSRKRCAITAKLSITKRVDRRLQGHRRKPHDQEHGSGWQS